MRWLGKLRRQREGVGSIIGAVFIILILLSGFTFYAAYLSTTDRYNQTTGAMDERSRSQTQERIVIKQISITNSNNLSITVENQGSVNSHLIWLGLLNKSAVPEKQWYFPLDNSLNPAETLNITSSFTVVRDEKYVVQVVTELGNVVQEIFYPASAVQASLSLTAASPTTYAGNNVTVMLTVTLNDTAVDSVQNITASINALPAGLVTLVGNSPLTVTGLARGESAFFWWVFNTITTGTVTFNATYSSASAGSFALTTVNVLSTPSGGGSGGNVVISGVNGTGEYNPTQLNTVGGTQNVTGSITALSANDNSYQVFSAYYTGTGTNTNHFVDNSASNVDGSSNMGTHSNFPAQQVGPDAIYDTLTEAGSTSTNMYHPSSYSLIGSTILVSGIVTNLQTDNDVDMTFRSYVSATSVTSKTDAFITYRSSTQSGLSFPKNQLWDGDAEVWGGENELTSTNSPVRWGRTAICPISERNGEKIVVTLSDEGYLDSYIFDGTSWAVTNNIGYVGTTANAYKCFDVIYEETSGDILLVYSIAPNTNFRIGYKTWTPALGWSSENIYTIASGTGQTAYWISTASKPTSESNEIAIGVIGDSTQQDCYGLIWDGTSFTSQRLLTGSVSITTRECIAVAYEQTSGYATFVSSTSHNAFSWQWSGSAWDGAATTFDLSGSSTPNWFTLKANPANDELFAVSVDVSSDLNTAYWSGSAWILHTEHDNGVDTNVQRCADFAWEPTGNKGLLVWGTVTGQIAYKTFTAPNTWGTRQNIAMGANIHPWVQLKTNSRAISGDMMILGAVMEGGTAFDIGAIKWDGITFTVIGTNTISSDTTVITYECFELEFQQFGDATEFTVEGELIGTSNTDSWTQLTWAIDSSFTASGVTSTFQLYNYVSGTYSISGDGYLTDTIGTTDITKTQTITVNPNQFKDASGNWKIKISGVKTTTSQFNWSGDLVTYESSATNYQINLEEQFTSVDFSQTNEWLCIYGGTIGAENLRVDCWNGASWVNLIPALVSGWNNVSISPYLTSSTFTIKFSDAAGDSVQDNWSIDLSLLHLWTLTDQYTAEVEFAGSSNQQEWESVLWQLQSCWDTDQVSVSLQWYNYTLGAYATSGNGYLSYVSSATPNTNELKSKSETLNANDFKNSTGYWKVKITGVKTSATQFVMKIDWIDLQTTYLTNGDTIPYQIWQYYTIKATTPTGTPIPFAYVSIYTNATSIAIQNQTYYPLNNPDYVHLNVDGTYLLRVKSANIAGETFVIYAVVGSVVGQKTITQESLP